MFVRDCRINIKLMLRRTLVLLKIIQQGANLISRVNYYETYNDHTDHTGEKKYIS
jgi:hypothetical protein